MAEYTLENDAVVTTGGAVKTVFGLAGALSSVLLVAGAIWWGYDLSVRDVTGVPVVRALEGPARVQPEDPGGRSAEHQGLAVNEVQAEGATSGPTNRIVLAPSGIDLLDEDVILPEAQTVSAPTPLETEDELEAAIEPTEGLLVANTDEAVEAALALALEIEQSDAEIAPIPAVVQVSRTIPGVKISPRPDIRPDEILSVLRNVSAHTAGGNPLISAALPSDQIEPGTRLVQLGAFDDHETAEKEWGRITAQFADYMDGKARVIQEATSGGRKFYRLRATGFDDLSASRRFCSVLIAANAACIPVIAR